MPVLDGREQEKQGILEIASILNADNRLYYRIGAVARRLRYMPEASVIIGIPHSVTEKNPYFDREKG